MSCASGHLQVPNRALEALLAAAVGLFFSIAAAQAAEILPEGGKLLPVERIQLYAEEHGKGPTLVLLHNFGSSSQAWKFALPELAGRFHVVLIDLPGHGHSTGWSVPKFDYPGAARAIFEVLDKLGVKDFELIGPSIGGALALRMAAEQPERISALVTIGGFDRVSDEAAAILKAPGCETLSPDELELQRKIHANGDEQIRAIQKQFCNEVENTGALTPPLAKIKARTLIVQGDHDRFFPLHVGVGLYAAIPKSYLWVVPDSGHLPCFDEKHRDSFLKVAIEFLGSDWESRH
jgi:pimeloyl-ACP methyl ester carboxylesterase